MPTMAPDQRAALELVLRQGRSYGELADLLGLPEETIRTRARGGVAALAPDLPAPPRAGEIADWLLGQQAEAHAARTRAHLLSDPTAHVWAAVVAGELRTFPGGESVPELPTAPEETPRPMNGTPRPVPEPSEPPGRSSRLGGALLVGAAVVLVVSVLAFVLLRDGGEDPVTASDATPTPSATATPKSLGYIMLKGPAGSTSVGAMQLFEANDGTVRFALAAQGVEPNKSGQRYSLWLTKNKGGARILGDVQQPVSASGELTSAGPGNADVDKFPQWFQTYDAIVVTLDDSPDAKQPGKVILKGDLPHSRQG